MSAPSYQVTENNLPRRAQNRWSDARLRADGYEAGKSIPVTDREEVFAMVAQKIAEGYHVVLKREYRGGWRRLYTKKQEATNG